MKLCACVAVVAALAVTVIVYVFVWAGGGCLTGVVPAQLAVTRIAARATNAARPRVNFTLDVAKGFLFSALKIPNIPTNPKVKTESMAIRYAGNWESGAVALRNVLALPPVCVTCALLAAVAGGVWMVSMVDAGPLVVLRLGGLKAQVAPVGRPEQLKVTGCLNPFSGVTVRVIEPVAPAVTFRVGELIEKEKSGAGAAATVMVATAEVEEL